MKNKLFYAKIGAQAAFSASCANLHKKVQLFVDDKPVQLPNVEAVAVLNIPSMYGGSNLWGTQNSRRFENQHIGDGLIEVVGIYSSVHIAQVRGGLRQHAKRLAQGSKIVIKTQELLPMQTDGEPWMQAACTVTITLHNKMPMLRKAVR